MALHLRAFDATEGLLTQHVRLVLWPKNRRANISHQVVAVLVGILQRGPPVAVIEDPASHHVAAQASVAEGAQVPGEVENVKDVLPHLHDRPAGIGSQARKRVPLPEPDPRLRGQITELRHFLEEPVRRVGQPGEDTCKILPSGGKLGRLLVGPEPIHIQVQGGPIVELVHHQGGASDVPRGLQGADLVRHLIVTVEIHFHGLVSNLLCLQPPESVSSC
mmetsp:Transcript_26092/g.67231  ORF Transcript_26092/g.67231 Transcript_26092/m.67231 type:complete len:219 (+) Transcript_26092:1408-2064(+)